MQKFIVFFFCLFFIIISGTMSDESWREHFEIKLFKEIDKYTIAAGKANYVYSPISILHPLILVSEGSNNKTLEEYNKFFGEDSDLTKAFPKDINLESEITAQINNKLYMDESLRMDQFTNKYIIKIKDKYPNYRNKELIDYVDFMFNSNQACKQINKWVESTTENIIKELVKPSNVDSNTKLVIVNTLYFNGEWLNTYRYRKIQFYPSRYLNPNSETEPTSVDAMEGIVIYKNFENYLVAILPYKNKKFNMVIYMPKNESLKKEHVYESSKLTEMFLKTIKNDKRAHFVIPKFKLSKNLSLQYNLKEIFSNIGLKNAMSEFANYSNLTSNNVSVSSFEHLSHIDVNEKGTEAVAATFLGVTVLCAFPCEIQGVIDRPFLFQIRYEDTKTHINYVLFQGQLNDIAQAQDNKD